MKFLQKKKLAKRAGSDIFFYSFESYFIYNMEQLCSNDQTIILAA